jgi:hypothetical protein
LFWWDVTGKSNACCVGSGNLNLSEELQAWHRLLFAATLVCCMLSCVHLKINGLFFFFFLFDFLGGNKKKLNVT